MLCSINCSFLFLSVQCLSPCLNYRALFTKHFIVDDFVTSHKLDSFGLCSTRQLLPTCEKFSTKIQIFTSLKILYKPSTHRKISWVFCTPTYRYTRILNIIFFLIYLIELMNLSATGKARAGNCLWRRKEGYMLSVRTNTFLSLCGWRRVIFSFTEYFLIISSQHTI